MDTLVNLGLALSLGLLIGAERGWQARAAAEGSRIAGIRTFGLIGFLGGLCGLLAKELGEILLGFAFGSLAAILIFAHFDSKRGDRDAGITTLIAALVTFVLGVLAVRGYPLHAAAGAVATAILLSLKPLLHSWLLQLEGPELYGGLKLLLISVVLLPVLPDQGYGPWHAVNPYEIWWLVVLIATLSYAGYFAMKLAGTRRGLMLTAMFGGLISSTAVTLNFSRLARRLTHPWLLSAGILLASTTMFPRVALEIAVVNYTLLPHVVTPLLIMTGVMLAGVAWLWSQRHGGTVSDKMELPKPLELLPAIQFGLVLAGIMLLVQLTHAKFGEQGVYALAGISGLADVDAISLTLARMAYSDLDPAIAARSVIIALLSNTISKTILATLIAGWDIGRYLLPVTSLTVLAGLAGILMT